MVAELIAGVGKAVEARLGRRVDVLDRFGLVGRSGRNGKSTSSSTSFDISRSDIGTFTFRGMNDGTAPTELECEILFSRGGDSSGITTSDCTTGLSRKILLSRVESFSAPSLRSNSMFSNSESESPP